LRHRLLWGVALAVWAAGVAGALLSGPSAGLAWMVPVAVGSTAGLFVRHLRTVGFVLPVAAVARLDADSDWPRMGAALLAVLAAIVVVGLLDAWSDSRPPSAVAALCSPADLVRWRSMRRTALPALGALLLTVAAGWLLLGAATWSTPGWVLALLPAVAILAVAVATWPWWRPSIMSR
jgi:hypothetical protein